MPSLPTDVIYRVLDFLPEDHYYNKKNQASFSLLSTTWKDRARAKLFHEITYSFRRPGSTGWDGTEHRTERLGRYGRVYNERETTPYKTLAMLVDFCEGHRDCASYVRTLTLRARPVRWQRHPFHNHWLPDFTSKDKVDTFLLARLLDLLPNLTYLNAFMVIPRYPPPLGPFTHPCLRTLQVGYHVPHEEPHVTGFLTLAQCFVRIPELIIDTRNLDYWDPPMVTTQDNLWPNLGPSIESLDLYHGWETPSSLLRMLMLTPTLQTLHTLIIERPFNPSEQSTVNGFIHAVGPNLKTLRCTATTSGADTDDDIGTPLDLSSCTKLQSLHLVLDLPTYTDNTVEHNICALSMALSTMTQSYPHLEDITIIAIYDSNNDYSLERVPSAGLLERALYDTIARSAAHHITWSGKCYGDGRKTPAAWFPNLVKEDKLEISS